MAFIIPTILAQGIYAGIIGTISSVTIGTCSLVKSIYTHQNPDVTKIIKEMDIERRLHLIQAVINTIDKESTAKLATVKLNELEKTQIFEMVNTEVDLMADPIELCLVYLHETIQDIHNDLIAINKKVAYHNTKWFSSWRTLNIKPLLDNLKINSNLLTQRFDDLTKISIFLKNK
ncbi:hypothetical protein QJ856_gp0143 [Tupanvirus deep ocean]|uniref:Uncharacterized protein n=2 Tax=Tupanvirus TaxID=2094720 RepID=A0AC62AA28_9VIRU|nr:hypothetical protein QJ856_gp0143 [Tupanvirus deep ocean]QKU34584.1 hypothetical protein [Tupanvirus deep ocean]